MLTTGQIITKVIQNYMNVSQGQQWRNPQTRGRLRDYLREIMSDAFNWAPYLFRHETTASVTITANTGVGPCPADFMSEGTQTRVLFSPTSGNPFPLTYRPEGDLLAWKAIYPTTGGSPRWYTWMKYINQGTRQIGVWPSPTASSTVLIKSYNRKCVDPIDFPQKPTVTVGGTGILAGSYKWKCTFTWANGETEGGFESEATTMATQFATVQVPIPLDVMSITGVKFYRTTASGTTFLLSGSKVVPDDVVFVSSESVIQYADTVADTDLGAACPFPITAYTGTEQFPDDFHEMVLFEGTKAKAMETQGDQRDIQFWGLFRKNVKRMWAETKPGQNIAYSMPAYGQGEWDRTAIYNRIPSA